MFISVLYNTDIQYLDRVRLEGITVASGTAEVSKKSRLL